MKFNNSRSAMTMACALFLTACGGGGGGSSGAGFLPPTATTTATTTPAVASTPTTPATTTTVAPAGTEELAAFTLLNGERLKCGFGSLARNAQLDAAAKGHANWLLVNNYTGHGQLAGTAGFTGATGFDRAIAAGYSAAFVDDENVVVSGASSSVGYGVSALRSLLSAPYHIAGLLAGYRDVGLSVMSSDDAGSTAKHGAQVVLQVDLAYTAAAGPVPHAAGTVLSYPCDGTTGTYAQLRNEAPNPVPGRDLAASPLGQAVYMAGTAGKVITITSALFQEKVTGNTLSVITPITGANDPNKELNSNEAIVIPNAPLKVSTAYIVTIVGTNDGASFTKTFGFTTGALLD